MMISQYLVQVRFLIKTNAPSLTVTDSVLTIYIDVIP